MLEDLSRKYEGDMRVYKVNTDLEPELSGTFGIQSVQTLAFVTSEGIPSLALGALPKR